MALGLSGAAATTISTVATVAGGATIATFGVMTASSIIEQGTSGYFKQIPCTFSAGGDSYNPIRDSVFRGNQSVYDGVYMASGILTAGIIQLGTDNIGLKPQKSSTPNTKTDISKTGAIKSIDKDSTVHIIGDGDIVEIEDRNSSYERDIRDAEIGQSNGGTGKDVRFNGKTVTQDNSLFDPNAIDNMGRTNVQRMQQGLAPKGYDGQSVNIHHIDQTNTGPVIEVLDSVHKQEYSSLHTNTGQSPSLIDRNAFNKWKKEYWEWRTGDFK
jgi:hypothetical protein